MSWSCPEAIHSIASSPSRGSHKAPKCNRSRGLALHCVAALAICSGLTLSTSFSSFTGASRQSKPCVRSARARPSLRAGVPLQAAFDGPLAQLAGLTTLSIDTGDLDVIAEWAETGSISDATTNPLFVAQAGLSGDPRFIAMVDDAVAFAKASDLEGEERLNLAMDRLSVNLGSEISKLVKGYISTEVDIRESFDTEASVARARRIIKMYEELGVPRSRVLIKLAATWEGIKAAEILEKEGITCNLTLLFGFAQGVACGHAGVRLISPFPGRVLDWYKQKDNVQGYEPQEDPGVVVVRRIFEYYKKYGHDTIVMPASWRPSRGAGYELDEILALAGVDRMTIPPPLLEKVKALSEPVEQVLDASKAIKDCNDSEIKAEELNEKAFRMMMNADVCATAKLAEGINAFVAETQKLREALQAKF